MRLTGFQSVIYLFIYLFIVVVVVVLVFHALYSRNS